MHKILLVILFLVGAISVTGQKLWQKKGIVLSPPVCYASDKVEKVFTPPPAEIMNRLKSAEKKSDFVVTYSLFPKDAIDAFDYAVSILEQLIESPVPIHIQANWRPKGQNVLGSCAPADFEKNFEGAPQKGIYYPIALAEKILGKELTDSVRPDIVADFNKEIDWYFGTDGNTPVLMYDFVSVVLHEICHGLGFTGFFYVDNQLGGYGFWEDGDATSFDRMVERFNGDNLIDTSVYTNPSEPLKNALVSGLLYANSPVAKADGNNARPRLYAPSSWDGGSSIYHLNDNTYPSGNINSLMTHSIGRGQAIHDPGPLTMGILADLGWKNMLLDFAPVKDREEVEPLQFEVNISSDFPLDTNQLFVVISSDTFMVKTDSVPLLINDSGKFEAEWTPDPGSNLVQYYISADDTKGRTFRNPSEAPNEFFTINFGQDIIRPKIEHDPIPYYFFTGKSLEINVLADDNLGIDTVFVEYSVNGQPQPSFGLLYKSGKLYSSIFPFFTEQLNDGDLVEYSVVAIDSSVAQNTRRIPLKGSFSFIVEKMYDPVAGYENNFDMSTSDFILSDFAVFTENGFENGALHSPHPYPSPEIDDSEFNFKTILKYPVILAENATMSFDEIVLVEPGTNGTVFGDFEFWDFVIVEGSKDNGETWLPVTDGYDARENSSWETNYNNSITGNNSTAAGSPDLFINRQINILENGNFSAGDTILFRFRLFSDPYANGWGWAIDNLLIQSPVSSALPVLSPGNIQIYPNPFTGSFRIDVHLNKMVEELQFEVYNMYGQKVNSKLLSHISGNISAQIEIENTNTGMYLVVIRENGNQVFTKKLIRY
ncbi:T9SS type A sorting domain-containing protein [Mariniphaga sp.]|uniref:T9SS type A sorting domain-containing protein n=1 Tax=Mariniphaga sp. TaxID=1954475 RepID=UPI0035698D79